MAQKQVIVRLITAIDSSVKDDEGLFIQRMRSAPMQTCREVVNVLKAEIKDKHNPPHVKLRALSLFHNCMILRNFDFAEYASTKIAKRLLTLAKYKKKSPDPGRGSDMFGPLSAGSQENTVASSNFLRYLLLFIRQWAELYPVAKNGRPSMFQKGLRELEAAGVHFPEAPRPAPPPQQPRPEFLRITQQDIVAVYETVNLIEELLSSNCKDATLLAQIADTMTGHINKLDGEIRAQGSQSHHTEGFEKVTKAKNDAVRSLEKLKSPRSPASPSSPSSHNSAAPGRSSSLRKANMPELPLELDASDKFRTMKASSVPGDLRSLESKLAAAKRKLAQKETDALELRRRLAAEKQRLEALQTAEQHLRALEAENDEKDEEIRRLLAQKQALQDQEIPVQEVTETPFFEEEEPVRKSIVLSNEREFRSIWFAEKGVLLENDDVKVSFMVRSAEKEVQMKLLIFNKPTSALERLQTSPIECADGSFTVAIDREFQETSVPSKSTVERVLVFRLNMPSGTVPRLAFAYEKENSSAQGSIQLPVTLLRFCSATAIDAAKLLQHWESPQLVRAELPLGYVNPMFQSLGDLVAAVAGRNHFQVVTSQDSTEINERSALCTARLHTSGVLMRLTLPPKGRVEVRTSHQVLTQAFMQLVALLQ